MIHCCYKGKNASHSTEYSDAMKKFDLFSQLNEIGNTREKPTK